MRIRTTRPVFWRSKTIAQLDWPTRLVLKGLESYVDDNGVGKDSVPLICADVFPYDLSRDPRDTIASVSRALQTLCDAGLIARYEVDDEALIYVRRWKQLQKIDRPNDGRYPRPDGSLSYTDDVDENVCAGQSDMMPNFGESLASGSRKPRESLATTAETVATVVEEEGSRGEEEKSSSLALVRGVQGGTPAKTAPGKPAAKRRTQIRDDYMPSKSVVATIRAENPTVTDSQLTYEHGKFIDHWKKTGKPMADWDAAWRNWMRTSSERGDFTRSHNGRPPPIGKPTQKAMGWEAVGAELLAEMEHE